MIANFHMGLFIDEEFLELRYSVITKFRPISSKPDKIYWIEKHFQQAM